jgi:hypothetical protein
MFNYALYRKRRNERENQIVRRLKYLLNGSDVRRIN